MFPVIGFVQYCTFLNDTYIPQRRDTCSQNPGVQWPRHNKNIRRLGTARLPDPGLTFFE